MRGNEFNVFDPSIDLRRNYFIEASAGTGKTFTIENSVVRLIQEGIPIDRILVVTFTRAATEELKTRIRRTMEEKQLKKELALFDEAKIFTIHGFCFHTLKEHALDTGFALNQSEENLSQDALKNIFKDFLRTELSKEEFHPKQLERLLNGYQNDYTKLFKAVLLPGEAASKSFSYLLNEIKAEAHTLSFEKSVLFEKLLAHAPKFGKMCDKKKQIKEENVVGLQKFCALFEGNFEELFDLPVLKLVPENLLANQGPYPEILHALNQKLIPLLAEISSTENCLNLLKAKFKQFAEHICQAKDLVLYDDLLKKMHVNVRNASFCEKVRAGYQAVLIDEFQDTDRLQWEIFSTLFLGYLPLYLVGDPKQSIYRFRGADLYTYLEAKEQMGSQTWTTLTRNYRSDPALVHALNALFECTSDLIKLPKNGQSLTIPHIEPGLPDQQEGEIIFCQSDDEATFFSYITEEIARLHQQEGVSYKECAILVKDHFQAKRFCHQCMLPFVTKKSESLLESAAFPLFEELLRAAYTPRERHAVLKVMGGPLFRIPLEELEEKLEDYVKLFYHYHEQLRHEGILAFFKSLSEKALFPNESLYLDLLQLAELLAEKCSHFEGYLPCLHHLRQEDPESEELKARSKCGVDAIQVMTMHVSKGLEFTYVFPVGLLSTYDLKDEEELSEKMRQLYVAVTRAKKKLYLPLTEKDNTPIRQFLKKVLKDETLESFIQKHPHFSLIQCEKTRRILPLEQAYEPPKMTKLPPLAFASAALFSYSSLAEKKELESFPILSPGAMPAGVETGILLHRVLENLNFEKKEKDLRPFLKSQLQGTLLEPWLGTIEESMLNLMYFPLEGRGKPFCLADVDPKKMRREMEFLYPSQQPMGYIKGFVDLFFEHQGYFYIIDWKSNLLENYNQETLAEAVKFYCYDLQAQIYQTAVRKFLKLFEVEERLDGIYYYFLRGLNSKTQQGVYRYAG